MEVSESPQLENQNKVSLRKILFFVAGIFLFVGIVIFLYAWFIVATPQHATSSITVEVNSGLSVREITELMESSGVVKSDLALYVVLTYFHDPTKIFAGTYVFSGTENTLAVARKLAQNEIENNLVRLTLPEGIRASDMAARASSVLPLFDTDDYLIAVNGLEGKLFPDTYFLPETFTADDLATLQQKTFTEKLALLELDESTSSLDLPALITLASILEREANDETSMGLVSGILQNRLELGMPLQADATIEYILDKPLSGLTPADLKIDSPYNSYLYKGLPPTPIGNPGLTALKAALHPTVSDYFYYITDPDGEFHYARTYQEHLRNIELYLK